MKKRILASLLSLCLIVGLLPTAALAAEDSVDENVTASTDAALLDNDGMSGNCGATAQDNVTWALTKNEDGEDTYTLTISGSGAMADFEPGKQPWASFLSNITTINIANGITRIGSYAFRGSSIRSIEIPVSVNDIGDLAFLGCKFLEGFSLADGENTSRSFYISDGVVYKKSNDKVELYSYPAAKTTGIFIIPNNVTSLGAHSMRYATFTALEIPESVTEIGAYCFNNSSLTSLTIPSTVKSVGDSACSTCTDLQSVNFNATVKATPGSLFNGCVKLESVHFSNTIETISPATFKNNPNLKTVEFASDSRLSAIMSAAFTNCGLEKLEVRTSESLTWSQQPYTGCASLKRLIFNAPKVVFEGTAFSSVDNNCLVVLDLLNVNEISIPNHNNTTLKPMASGSVILVSSKARVSEIGNSFDKQATTILVTNGGTFAPDTEFTSDTLVTPTKEGCIFAGWYENAECTGNAVTIPAANKTYYAKWIELKHDGITLEYGSTSSDFPAIDGVVLSSWTSADPTIVKIDGDKMVATGVGETTITANAAPDAARSGETLTVSVTVTAKKITVSMENATVNYDKQPHTIEATASDNGTLPADLELVYSYKESTADENTYIPVAPTHPGTYTVKVESGNVNYTLTGKTTATLTISNPQQEQDMSGQVTVAAPSLTYDGKAKVYSAAYDGIDNWTIVYYNAEGEKLASAPVNTGDYWVTINGENKDKTVYASITESFTIGKATVTIRPNDKSAYVGDAVPVLGKDDYTVTGFVGDDTLSIKPTLAYESTPDMSQTGTYAIKASGAVVGPNYEISYKDGTLTVSRRSSGGGSSSGSSSSTTTETEKNPDGSTTTTVIDKKTGTVTETTKYKDGSTLVVETQKDGTVTTTETAKNGVKVKTVDEPGEDVTAKITVPKSVGEVVVTIPADADYGMVAVDAKTGEVVKLSVPTRDGMTVKLDGSAELVLVDRSRGFTDTRGHWAEDAIDFAAAHELFSGTGDAAFTPDSPMTRAMLMTVLARFDGQDITGGAVWYEKAMAWAKENGISDGSDPDGAITREQLATMLWRYSGSPAGDGSLSAFGDSASVSSYAAEALRWAVGEGLISGTDGGLLAPQGSATRAQVATILMRFVESLTK